MVVQTNKDGGYPTRNVIHFGSGKRCCGMLIPRDGACVLRSWTPNAQLIDRSDSLGRRPAENLERTRREATQFVPTGISANGVVGEEFLTRATHSRGKRINSD